MNKQRISNTDHTDMNKIFKNKILRLNQRKLFFLSFFFALFLVSTYLFSVNATIFNIAERTQIEKNIDILKHKIGELEFKLIAEKSKIDMNLAYSFGFEEAKNIKFITKKSVAIRSNTGGI